MTNQKPHLEILLASPRGFCAGVERAIDIVYEALKKYGAPIYVRHEIVHNKYVVEDLRAKGVVFVKEISEIPENAVTIFSAHGVSEKVEKNASDKNLEIIDATCPLVKKVHKSAIANEKKGKKIILIGHQGHPEVEGTSGRVQEEVVLVSSKEDVEKTEIPEDVELAYVTQTTLSVDDTKEIIMALKNKFPKITGPETSDICYATQNRQNAVKDLVKNGIEMLLVIGSKNSSNSNRLKDLAIESGIEGHLINSEKDIQEKWFHNKSKIGITAGASAPETLLTSLINHLEQLFDIKLSENPGVKENISFNIPKKLRS